MVLLSFVAEQEVVIDLFEKVEEAEHIVAEYSKFYELTDVKISPVGVPVRSWDYIPKV